MGEWATKPYASPTTDCLGEGKGMEWKEILQDIPSILHIGSLIRMKDRL